VPPIMQKIITYLKLFRVGNLLFIVLTQFALHYYLILPTLEAANISSHISTLDLILLITSTVLIAAGGYVINDYFDVSIDSINKPDRLYISKSIHRREAILWHQVFSVIAVVIGIYLAWHSGNLRLLMIQPITIALLWFYSTGYKKQPLLGNLLISFLTAFVVLLTVLYQTPLFHPKTMDEKTASYIIFIRIFYYFIFAFLVSMMREIVKDMEDAEGDERYGCRTVPILWGMQVAKRIVYAIGIVVIVLVIQVQQIPFVNGDYLTVIYLMQTIQLPILIAFWKLYTADSKKHYKQVSTLLKLVMLMGVLTIFYFYFLMSR
jgi:4-hydroxybenzoate polyprenyltransferase